MFTFCRWTLMNRDSLLGKKGIFWLNGRKDLCVKNVFADFPVPDIFGASKTRKLAVVSNKMMAAKRDVVNKAKYRRRILMQKKRLLMRLENVNMEAFLDGGQGVFDDTSLFIAVQEPDSSEEAPLLPPNLYWQAGGRLTEHTEVELARKYCQQLQASLSQLAAGSSQRARARSYRSLCRHRKKKGTQKYLGPRRVMYVHECVCSIGTTYRTWHRSKLMGGGSISGQIHCIQMIIERGLARLSRHFQPTRFMGGAGGRTAWICTDGGRRTLYELPSLCRQGGCCLSLLSAPAPCLPSVCILVYTYLSRCATCTDTYLSFFYFRRASKMEWPARIVPRIVVETYSQRKQETIRSCISINHMLHANRHPPPFSPGSRIEDRRTRNNKKKSLSYSFSSRLSREETLKA
jgi:hypothetical protein